MAIFYWNRAGYRGVAHATEFRNAVCGTSMGYGTFIWARNTDRKCARCTKILAKRGVTGMTEDGATK